MAIVIPPPQRFANDGPPGRPAPLPSRYGLGGIIVSATSEGGGPSGREVGHPEKVEYSLGDFFALVLWALAGVGWSGATVPAGGIEVSALEEVDQAEGVGGGRGSAAIDVLAV